MEKEHDLCEVKSFNKAKVKAAKRKMLNDDEAHRLAETFSVLSDPSRIKILHVISNEELCVCDIANVLGHSLSAVSHQLRILRNMRLVKYRKESKTVYYSLDDDHITTLFSEGLKHVRE